MLYALVNVMCGYNFKIPPPKKPNNNNNNNNNNNKNVPTNVATEMDSWQIDYTQPRSYCVYSSFPLPDLGGIGAPSADLFILKLLV